MNVNTCFILIALFSTALASFVKEVEITPRIVNKTKDPCVGLRVTLNEQFCDEVQVTIVQTDNGTTWNVLER